MAWSEAAREVLERVLETGEREGPEVLRTRLEGLRLAYVDHRSFGCDQPLAEGEENARTKGVWVLWMLRQHLGPGGFAEVRKVWEQRGALETESLRELCERLSRTELREFFDFWVYGTHLPDYRLKKAEVRPAEGAYQLTLVVENRGTGANPDDAVVQSEEGARHELRAAATPGAPTELQVTLVTKPVLASVDPDARMLMNGRERPWVPVRQRKFLFF